jgi:hypothetical protein
MREAMKRLGNIIKGIFWVITALALLLSGTAATYAWFTTNRTVSTDSVSGRSGTDSVALEISQTGGSSFRAEDEAAIVQVNDTSAEYLLPVSTADLQNFVYAPSTQDGMAAHFQLVEDEKYYYHGRVYIRAAAEGQATGTMALYLDQISATGGEMVQAQDGNLLNAARLGLTFNEADGMIFRLSQDTNAAGEQARNTLLGGAVLGDDQVLGYSGGTVTAVADPAVDLDTYSISIVNNTVTLPDQPLMYLELNQIYAVDIYFYLEGCDPDCSDSVSLDGADLHLAFYGVLTG